MLGSRLKFAVQRLREKLWIRPLGYAILAVFVILVARIADGTFLADIVPDISVETIEKLLTVISASMLGVATFAVASMVAAYASAGSNATPRAFSLIIADGMSQTALSSFVGAFIFSIVGLTALKVGYFTVAGRFLLFIFTIAIFAWVVLTFVRWVDNIARLGRLGNTVEKVEAATRKAFLLWNPNSPLDCNRERALPHDGVEVFASECGFVQHIDVEALQDWAEDNDAKVYVLARPGAFVAPSRPVAKILVRDGSDPSEVDDVRDAFLLDARRTFESDPRFGIVTLSEIGSRALSPGINDPGTAIEIALRIARILYDWDVSGREIAADCHFENVFVTPLSEADLIEDGYGAISKDGVGSVEFGIWLQKSLSLLAIGTSPGLSAAARQHAGQALERAKKHMDFDPDFERVKTAHDKAFASN